MMPRPRRVDVAVYAPYAGTLYDPEGVPVGGAELQSGFIVQALAAHGFRVRHLVSGADETRRDGVDVQPLPAGYHRGGLARMRATMRALHDAGARLYIQRSAGSETLAVGLFARAARAPFVFSSSSVADFVRDPLVAERAGASLDEWPTRVQYLAGLRLANAVVVQTDEQRALARSERGVDATVIRSFCPPAPSGSGPREAFLWIGGLMGSKDPVSYVELARRVPEAQFWMVAGDRGPAWVAVAREVRDSAAVLPNLRLLLPAGREETLALYGRAVAVVNTSWFEGFPNTFLEGWARGTPALSLRVDPDGVIDRLKLGASCRGSLDELAAAARRLWKLRGAIDSQPFRDYVSQVHAPEVIGAEWAALVRRLLD
jgi:glycosyltransferase involved in cell wall biosynthesis